ncbi:hypothetical protein RJ639_014961 [Escallonia herrerae]|uniref:J domain-containing protein n=1 Tax=Escallonia herrerae TaxID=1293975 RepID=A0AA88VGJ8_9ASTE|nr:hypothetical protein RJ639_014961 [Escallonia herrerae]
MAIAKGEKIICSTTLGIFGLDFWDAQSSLGVVADEPIHWEWRVKQCQYKVLGLGGDCTADDIRSAYHRLTLQRHPDKLAQFGISPAAYRRLALQAYQTSPFP